MLEKYLKFTVPSGSGCLEWTRCLNSDGYPRAAVNKYVNGKVHREVFFLVNGFYPEVVRHTCDNIKCINPDHLLAGTQLDNIYDRISRGRCNGHQTKEKIDEVISLRNSGLSYKEISDITGLKFRQIEYITAKSRKEG